MWLSHDSLNTILQQLKLRPDSTTFVKKKNKKQKTKNADPIEFLIPKMKFQTLTHDEILLDSHISSCLIPTIKV